MALLDNLSRFKTTEQIIVDGQETFGRWKPPDFLVTRPSTDNIGVLRISSAFEGRPDLISSQLYGVPDLWWVLVAFNNARDVLNWPKTGDLIEYPTENVVLPSIL